MSEEPTEPKLPCIRGCTWDNLIEGETPRPKEALHGDQLCNSCFYRMKYALEMIPDLMANMRAQVSGFGAAPLRERVTGGGDGSPAPLRIGPLDASDSLWAKLASWIWNLSETFKVPPPSIAVWMNRKEAQGSRPVSAAAAHDQAAGLVGWLLNRLEQISGSALAAEFHNDISYGWDDAPGVYRLAGAYGVEARPPRPADKRECPLCGEHEVFVSWPNKLNPDVMVLCGRCSWVAEGEKRPAEHQLLTVAEVSAEWDVSRQTVMNWLRGGLHSNLGIDGKRYMLREDVKSHFGEVLTTTPDVKTRRKVAGR